MLPKEPAGREAVRTSLNLVPVPRDIPVSETRRGQPLSRFRPPAPDASYQRRGGVRIRHRMPRQPRDAADECFSGKHSSGPRRRRVAASLRYRPAASVGARRSARLPDLTAARHPTIAKAMKALDDSRRLCRTAGLDLATSSGAGRWCKIWDMGCAERAWIEVAR